MIEPRRGDKRSQVIGTIVILGRRSEALNKLLSITQGSQGLALGLTVIAAPQLFCYRSLKPDVGHVPCCLEPQVV